MIVVRPVNRSCPGPSALLRSPSSVLSFLIIAIFWGCVQESPPPSVDRTVVMLLELLRDGEPEIRRTAVEALGKIGDPSTLDGVIPLMADSSPMVRSAAVKALGQLGAGAMREVVPRLLGALRDTDERVLRAAVEAIGDLDPPGEFLHGLSELLASPDVRVRRAAVLAIGKLEALVWGAELERALQDPDENVRQGAVAALGYAGLPDALPWIQERALHDPDADVRAEAAYWLGQTEDQGSRIVLKRMAEADSNPGVRRWARMQGVTD